MLPDAKVTISGEKQCNGGSSCYILRQRTALHGKTPQTHRFSGGDLPASKRCPFAFQYAVFCRPKDGILERKRYHPDFQLVTRAHFI